MDYQILVNKNNKVNQDLIDRIKLRSYQGQYQSHPLLVEEKTLRAFLKLKKYLHKNKDIIIDLEDAYRSPKESAKLYKQVSKQKGKKHADKYVAKPYTSEHNIGLAIDYVLQKDSKFIDNDSAMPEYIEFIIINNIAHKFGFILRYPKGKENATGYSYEPWHLRFVGKHFASKIYEKSLTLEEWFDK